MLGKSLDEILRIAVELDALQRRLLGAFFDQHTQLTDWKLLTDFPRIGTVNMDGQTWTYRKHGLGYSFSNAAGCVIDVHNHFARASRAIDAHRISEYLETSEGAQDENLYHAIEQALQALEKQGRLKKIAGGPDTWELVDR